MTPQSGWLARVDSMLSAAVAAGVTPGAALLVGDADAILAECYVGRLGCVPERPVEMGTIYDLSSLTKPLVTVSSLLMLAAAGRLSLEDTAVRWIPEFGSNSHGDSGNRASVRLRDLLAHRSGLPAHRRYFAAVAPEQVGGSRGAARILDMAAREPLEYSPGTRALYSDLGFMLLGSVVERASGEPLDRFSAKALFAPLGLESTGFLRLEETTATDSTMARPRIAPCGRCSWRSGEVHGVVHDENAYAMGGVAGHAGLFSTARGIHAVSAEYQRAFCGRPSLFARDLVHQAWTRDTTTPGSTWALGWDTPAASGSSAGSLVSARAVGHLGFTGTSLWIDLDRGVHVVLLTNRIQMGGDNRAVRELRPRVHDAVFAGLG